MLLFMDFSFGVHGNVGLMFYIYGFIFEFTAVRYVNYLSQALL